MTSKDTIFALSSGNLPSGVAVVRMSGPAVGQVLEAMAGIVPAERVATLCSLRSRAGEVLDRGLVLFFRGPRSFGGEDAGELHLHGGRAVVAAVLAELAATRGLRPAEPGEFTKRAFLNGKVDLLGAEALADLVRAETESQRRLALTGSGAAQSELYAGWRRRLIKARALLEAAVDFSDEEDVPGDVDAGVWDGIRELASELNRHIDGYAKAEIIREGYDVVILGPPNAGKSSLLNRLAAREVAIVTDEAGTTRDLLEVALDLQGVKVRVTDTAGIRTPQGRVEAIGIDRAIQRAKTADLVIRLYPADNPSWMDVDLGVAEAERIDVLSKVDLAVSEGTAPDCALRVSVVTGEGIDALLSILSSRAAAAGATGEVLPTRMRHVSLLREAGSWMERALAGKGGDIEMRAEELRLASQAIGRVIGEVDVEDLLDVIFGEFCIGK